jgi:Zn finger protein HypA/HybF involved in hydrogenase expression
MTALQKIASRVSVSIDEYERMAAADAGLCLLCETPAEEIEPDATRLICPACGARMVFGAEALLLMGVVKASPLDNDPIFRQNNEGEE